jgi:threonine/homoserine/homoserine lactone efflux protein
MTPELFFALATFALATVITPGPNNLMLMASGANYGFLRTVPHMAGIGLGFPAMVVLVGLGVMQLFQLWPPSRTVLTVLSAAFLLYLAWKIANAAPPGEATPSGRPLSFLQAAAFQWVNPKAWSMALSAITLYAPGREAAAVLWVAGVYVCMSVISTTTWTVLGQQVRRFLTGPVRLRVFNWSMALLLIAAMLPPLLAG